MHRGGYLAFAPWVKEKWGEAAPVQGFICHLRQEFFMVTPYANEDSQAIIH